MPVYPQRGSLLWSSKLAEGEADTQDPLVLPSTPAFYIYSAMHSLHYLQSF